MEQARPNYMNFHDFYVKSVSCTDNDTKTLEDMDGRILAVIRRKDAGDGFFDGFTEGELSFGYSTDSHKALLAIYNGNELVYDL